jgi:hypothetical protein
LAGQGDRRPTSGADLSGKHEFNEFPFPLDPNFDAIYVTDWRMEIWDVACP